MSSELPGQSSLTGSSVSPDLLPGPLVTPRRRIYNSPHETNATLYRLEATLFITQPQSTPNSIACANPSSARDAAKTRVSLKDPAPGECDVTETAQYNSDICSSPEHDRFIHKL